MNLFRNSLGTVASLALAVLLVAPAAEASRGGLPAAYEPALDAPSTPDQVLSAELSDPPERLRIFDDLSLPPRPLELVEARKTASGSSTYALGLNVWQTGDLSQECSGLSFQGLWTDPVTGIAYARNRWYDARTASWLSEDPLGAVDSPNLYAFVGWGPHVYNDPMGLRKPTAEDVAVENWLRSKVQDLDTQWEAGGGAYATLMWSEWRQKCALCVEEERVVDWKSVHIQSAEQYQRARSHLMNDLITFTSAVWEADKGGGIQYGSSGFFTVTDDWRRATAASALLLSGWNLTAGGNWALYATPYAVRIQMNQAQIAAAQEAAARSEAMRRMNPGTSGSHNLRTADIPPGAGNVPSNLKIRNQKLAGRTHPVTGVSFDEAGHPIFQSAFDLSLPKRFRGKEVPDEAQFSYATQTLWSAIQADPKIGRSFTLEQLRAIESGAPRIPGWTWHHHQNTLILQLTDRVDHAKTGHTGGRGYE